MRFGLTVLTMAFAIGHISGCHLNPAVSAGLVKRGRFPAKEFVPCVVAQVIGGIAGAVVLYLIASGQEGLSLANGFESNGYGEQSPGKYSVPSCFVSEAVLTFMLLLIIPGATDRRAPVGSAPIAIGLGLTLIHLIGIPVTNLSVNPARSTGPAVFSQMWLFWVAPLLELSQLASSTDHYLKVEWKRKRKNKPSSAKDRSETKRAGSCKAPAHICLAEQQSERPTFDNCNFLLATT